jgi:hypothetical protein
VKTPIGTIQVKGHADYVRDINTGAIIFNNSLKVNKYKEQQQLELKKDMEIEMLKKDIHQIKKALAQIMEIKQ